jgi:integrase
LTLAHQDRRDGHSSSRHKELISKNLSLAQAKLALLVHMPPIRFHDLRHTAATRLLGQGVHPKIVQEMLGHSSIAVTLDLYSHVTADMQVSAAAAMDTALGPTLRP